MTVHERLATIRKDAGLTQTEFAKKMGVSRRAYINYESGEREIPSAIVIKLSDELSINPNWTLTGKGQKTEKIQSAAIQHAVIAVRSFAVRKQLEIDPEREAKLVLLLVDYFEQDGPADTSFVQEILELAT